MSFLSKLLRLLREISLNVAGYRKVGTFDAPDERDYVAEELFGAKKIDLPLSVDLRHGFVSYDQGQTNHCSSYALCGLSEAMNRREHGFVRFDPESLWAEQLKSGASEKNGDTLQNALRSFVRMGGMSYQGKKYPATGYAMIKNRTPRDMQKWLARGFPIFTGATTSSSSWASATRTDELRITKTGGGHAIWIYGYENHPELGLIFWCQNSWGQAWGKDGDGNFFIPASDIMRTFTCYILYDSIDK